MQKNIYCATRSLPQKWPHQRKQYAKAFRDLFEYCLELRLHLCALKNYDAQNFDDLNSFKIDDYIDYFDNLFGRLIETTVHKETFFDFFERCKTKKLDFSFAFSQEFSKIIKKDVFVSNSVGQIVGFNPVAYNNINELANKIFVLEKYVGSITKKIWQKEIVDIKKFNQGEPFKLIVKIVFPYGWRKGTPNNEEREFCDSRIYQSASVISDKSSFCLFNYFNQKESALLVFAPQAEKIMCGRQVDAFSDEFINGKNPNNTTKAYSCVTLIDKFTVKHKLHELYATATEVITPNILLHNGGTYNEVILRNPTVVGVLAPNERSVRYAQEMAKRYGVKYHGVLEQIERFNYQTYKLD